MPRTNLIRAFVLLLALAMVAAGCSKPKTAGDVDAGGKIETPEVSTPVGIEDQVAAPGDTTPVSAPVAGGANAAPGGAKAGTKPGASLVKPAGADVAQEARIGALIKPQSTQRRKPYYQGVTEDAIKLVFSIDASSCGVNVVGALTAAGGALPTQGRYYRAAPTTPEQVAAENRESINAMVQYWNENAFARAESAPEVRKLMGNDRTRQFFGRRLVHEIIDGGSNQCPDKTTGAAREAVDDKKAFVVYNNFDGAAFNMAAALNAAPAARRPMHFGTLWQSDKVYDRFAPFAWTQFATGSTITRQWASYICSRIRTGAVPGRSPMVTDPKKRVFGLVHTNNQQDKELAAELKGYLRTSCGADIITKEVEYDGTDFGKAQQDNPNVIVQLKLAGVTTVLMLTDPVQPLFQLQQATRQDYFPEWVFSSFGYADSNTVMRLYKDTGQSKAMFGLTQLGVYGGFGFGSGDPFAMWNTLHKKSPKSGKVCDPATAEGMDHDATFCKAPTSLATWYYVMLPSIGAMTFAGPDLTPQNATKGLQDYPTTRYGGSGPTTDPRPALVGAGRGRHGFIVDGTEWRWRPDFTSPAPESKAGWVEYPDCMRHYISWPDQLAPGWEKSGPNFGAWCGDKNGYPRVLDADKR